MAANICPTDSVKALTAQDAILIYMQLHNIPIRDMLPTPCDESEFELIVQCKEEKAYFKFEKATDEAFYQACTEMAVRHLNC